MGLGKVIGWGVAFMFLLGVTITSFADVLGMVMQASLNGMPISLGWLVASLGAGALWAIITYFVGRRFVRAIKQYRASRAGKPLQ
jgi:uncharacterized protein (DUF2062 family)